MPFQDESAQNVAIFSGAPRALVWNIEIEKGKENEKVGGKQAKLNESESGRELERGDAILLKSSGRGSRKETEKGGKIILTSSGRGIEKGGAI